MSHSHSASRSSERVGVGQYKAGLSLLELVVALSILAVLSTVAVRAIDPLADQARYESTRSTLDKLKLATVGDAGARQLGGQPIVSGYLGDVGILPTALVDFTTQPGGISAYAVQTFDSDRDGTDDVTLTSGWNGPYLFLGAGQLAFVDGWGAAPLVDPDGGTFDFTSRGSDGDAVLPEDGYRADLTVAMPTNTYTSDVVFRLFDINGVSSLRIDPTPTGLEQLGVLVYSVNAAGGTSGTIQELLLPVAAVGTFEASISSAIHGPMAARAILWSDTNSDDQLDSGEPIVLQSYVHYMTVTSLSDLRIEMDLR